MPSIKFRSAADVSSFRTSEVGTGQWADLSRLFEQRGGPHNCWCMAWREMPSRARRDKSAKKAHLKERVGEGVPIGILGYIDDEPVAWCSVGPRSSFRRLAEENHCRAGKCVWSITCFFVRKDYRNLGLTGRLIDHAVSYARSNGADVVEAYPVDKLSPSYRFMGFVPHFEQAGFAHVGKAGTRRHVMQLRGNQVPISVDGEAAS